MTQLPAALHVEESTARRSDEHVVAAQDSPLWVWQPEPSAAHWALVPQVVFAQATAQQICPLPLPLLMQ